VRESNLWQQIKRNVPGHLIRIENLVGAGVPDVNACYQGSEVWIELKVAKGHWVHFRTSQIAWFAKRLPHLGNVKVVMRKGDMLYVVKAETVLALEEFFVPNKDQSLRVPVEKLFGFVCTKPFPWKTITEKIYEGCPD